MYDDWIAQLEEQIAEFTKHAEDFESGRSFLEVRAKDGNRIDVSAGTATVYRRKIADHRALIERLKAKV